MGIAILQSKEDWLRWMQATAQAMDKAREFSEKKRMERDRDGICEKYENDLMIDPDNAPR